MLLILVCHDGHNVHNVQPFVEVGLESVLGKAHGQELGPHLIFIHRTLLNSSLRAWVGTSVKHKERKNPLYVVLTVFDPDRSADT